MEIAKILDKETILDKGKNEYFIRFNLSLRIEHIVLMVTFIVLSVTGLAQKFYSVPWAEWVILSLGGIEYVRLIHRIFALIFTLGIVYHISYVFYGLFAKHTRPTMLPTVKDLRDVINELRYSFGFVDKPPQFDRYDYRQKFEYWGIIFGSFILIVSGIILVFPVLTTQLLPGEIVPAAKEFHGNEAVLAVIVIVIWHLYDVILRPGIFPADTSIFTGRISKKRLIEEHPLEYAILTETKPDEEELTLETPPAE